MLCLLKNEQKKVHKNRYKILTWGKSGYIIMLEMRTNVRIKMNDLNAFPITKDYGFVAPQNHFL